MARSRATFPHTLVLGERWIILALASLGAALLVLGFAASAGAYPGDYRLVQGQIVVWPDEQDGSRVAVVRGSDDGDLYFIRVPAGTSGATLLGPGQRVAIVGRADMSRNEIVALSMRPTPGVLRDATPNWRVVTGIVESVSGSTAVISGRSGQWTVDLSPLDGIDRVTRGEQVTIVGRTDGGRLVASGIARDTEAPSALPRSR